MLVSARTARLRPRTPNDLENQSACRGSPYACRHSRSKQGALAGALNQRLVQGMGIPKATASS